ncbi:diaminopimelate epimerase [Marinigracilibium pacificum]|uniref:Diaminopimelate epimerase n=1 Tax=Marinigracilibium pacificum TaxID=2729599 RepID=A0A848IYM0_9BACT|nr:diaminopimelate epimerase [Marinigracilibium pacificum]NMM47089.1 diaminopimelate epimerase [Marinigracilibium pacificum]
MIVNFYKYQGAGNDFVMLDNRNGEFDSISINTISFLCDRRFGIGADGLITVSNSQDKDFDMVYYNADGSQSFCGNGSRCAVRFAQHLGMLTDSECDFNSTDGPHSAKISDDNISIDLYVKGTIKKYSEKEFFIDTGSPHHIVLSKTLENTDVKTEGSAIRYSEKYAPSGSNVNFISLINDSELSIRTYERGVEDETLACGTGITAAALTGFKLGIKPPVKINAKGGTLFVTFKHDPDTDNFSDIWLTGPAEKVFEGKIEI